MIASNVYIQHSWLATKKLTEFSLGKILEENKNEEDWSILKIYL
jgi:hypothetical protein